MYQGNTSRSIKETKIFIITESADEGKQGCVPSSYSPFPLIPSRAGREMELFTRISRLPVEKDSPGKRHS